MPRKLPPYVERNHVNGHTYLSFRRGKGQRVRLPDDPTSEEFHEAYRAALSGDFSPPKRRTGPAPGTIAALIASYMRTTRYTSLRTTTKKGYASRIEALRVHHGHRSVSGLTRERIENGILSVYAEKPGARLSMLKMLRVLIDHARKLDIGNPCRLESDPSAGIVRPKSNEIRAWTDAELEAFEHRWPLGTKQRTAYSLMLYIGAARVDVHRMRWTDFGDGGVVYSRNKTGVTVEVPVHRELAAALTAAPRAHVTIINTEYGRPFTVAGFSGFMRDAMNAAGLPMDCKPHGLRKTLGRRMADASCTAHEIMAALGHKTLAEAERYTREADRRRGGRAAIAKLEAHTTNNIAQNVGGALGKSAKKEGVST